MYKWIILFLFPLTAVAQTWTWGIKGTGTHQPAGDMEIAVFNDGSSVVAGYFQETLQLGDFVLHTDDDYYSDHFLARISREGKVLWAKQMEAGSTYNNQLGLAIDDDRNIYLTGARSGYIFAAKFDSLGNEIWSNNFNQKYYGYGGSIATDRYDNVYIVGGGGWNFFASRLNFNGKVDWIQNASVNYSAGFSIYDMKADDMGNLYFAGTFGIDSIQLGNLRITQKGSAVWGKISPQGKFIWAKTSTGRVNSANIALSGNSLYISGSFSGEMKTGGITLQGLCCSNPKPFVAKYDTAGNQIWAKTGNTTYENKGTITASKADLDGNLYVTGGYFTCYGVYCTEGDYFIEKYNPAGNVIWRMDFNHPSGDACTSFDFDASGNFYLAGRTMASDFTNPRSEAAFNSFGFGKLTTNQPAPRRIDRPGGDRIQYNCSPDGFVTLNAVGQNLKWYDDANLKNKIHEGNSLQRIFTATDTVYITQTIGTAESRPKQMIVYKPATVANAILHIKDTLYIPADELLRYQWYFNSQKIPGANQHYHIPEKNGMYEIELLAGNCSQRISFDFQRPEPPASESIRYFCPGEPAVLTATGENIVWYANTSYNDTLATGNEFRLASADNRSVYVRQTVDGITSYPAAVRVRFSQLKDTIIQQAPGALIAQRNNTFRYRWYYYNQLLTDTAFLINPEKNGRYSVTITDSICSRSLSSYYVKQPAVEKTSYFLCPTDTFPVIHATGNDILWLAWNDNGRKIDTLAFGPVFHPTKQYAPLLVIDRDSFYNSIPVYLYIRSLKDSKFTIQNYGNSLSLETNIPDNLNYTWYRNNESLAIGTVKSIYNPPFGDYYVNVSHSDRCDTLISYRYYPQYDSIRYVCSTDQPLLYVASVSLEWYPDKSLSKKLYTGSYFYTWPITGDTAVYVVQRRNDKIYWQGKFELRYPDLTKTRIIQQAGQLRAEPSKPYYRYQWMYNDTLLTDTTSVITPAEDGMYRVVISAGQCYTEHTHQFVRSGLDPTGSSFRFSITPNPATHYILIDNAQESNEPVDLKIFSLNGQLTTAQNRVSLPARINVQHMQPGSYIVEIQNENKVQRSMVLLTGPK